MKNISKTFILSSLAVFPWRRLEFKGMGRELSLFHSHIRCTGKPSLHHNAVVVWWIHFESLRIETRHFKFTKRNRITRIAPQLRPARQIRYGLTKMSVTAFSLTLDFAHQQAGWESYPWRTEFNLWNCSNLCVIYVFTESYRNCLYRWMFKNF